MYTRRKINPVFRTTLIVLVIVVAVFLIGRLDFFGWVLRGLNELVPSRSTAVYTEDEAEDYRAEIGELQAENAILREIVTDLQNRLEINENESYSEFERVDAQVVWRDHSRLFESVLINRGTADGLEVGMPVVDAYGLVGRVVEVRGAISRVELISNPDCSFGVIDQRSRELGIISGTDAIKWQREDGLGFDGNIVPPDILELGYLSPSADIRTDDVLITSGLSGITPEGILVGQVDQIISQQDQDWYEIRVMPYADLERLENVAVIIYREQGQTVMADLLDDNEENEESPAVELPGD